MSSMSKFKIQMSNVKKFLTMVLLGGIIITTFILLNGRPETTLKITANVEGARVAIDNPADFPTKKELKEIPLTVRGVAPGKHTISAYKEGYQEVIEKVNVEAGKTTKVAIFMVKKIQILFEKISDEKDMANIAWLDNDTAPDGKKTASLTDTTLIVSDLKGNTIKEVEFEKDTIQATSAWLSENEIILIEKEKEMPYLDRIYLVNLKSPKKIFLITSATVIGRLDLNFIPRVSPKRDKLLLKENNGPLLFAVIKRE